MAYGLGKSLVVEKDAAVLGYANESATYLNANHREICKYATAEDSNYRTVRNALASTLDELRKITVAARSEINNEQLRLLDNLLEVSSSPEDYLMDVDNLRLTGSCEWLPKRETFQQWRDGPATQMYWVSAKPATGKTVASGKVVNHLKNLGCDIAFYFFDYRNKSQTTISSFLLSLVAQMAHTHVEVMHKVLEIFEKDDQLYKADYRTIWRKLFIEGILRVKFSATQYWVIDALDECKSELELVPLLLRLIESHLIRILLTCRNCFGTYKLPPNSKATVMSAEISIDETKSDIALYLEAHMPQVPATDQEARRDMVSIISNKSGGCFLWVSLILQELSQAHTSSEVRHILEEIPSDMNDLYSRILDQMSRAPAYGKSLAKAILTWTVCAARPLTTLELSQALRMDINDTISSVEASIESRCGQLIYVDAQSRVQIIHQTARDYLLHASDGSEFGIDRKMGHGRLLATCLEYLHGSEMRGPKHRNLSVGATIKRGPFASYACNSFFEHILHVSSQDDEFLIALGKFLGSSDVLTWIEYIAGNSDLNRLIKAANAVRNFLRRRLRYLAPFGKDTTLLGSWATDLIRLVTKFGKEMKSSPSSIHHLIPPFCPRETAPSKQFVNSGRGMTVVGLSSTGWDDCLSTIVDPHEQLSALASSDQLFALGTSSGKIVVYIETTCQEAQILQHQESVTLLSFGGMVDCLVCTGPRSIRLWDTSSWNVTWESNLPQQCMSVAFIEEDQLLLGALRNNRLMIWDLPTGMVRDAVDWTENIEGPKSHSLRRPMVAAFCMESCLLAVVYRGQDILLWDLESYALYDTYGRQGSSSRDAIKGDDAGVICLVFCGAPNVSLLAAGYSDGELSLFDTAEGIVKETVLVNAQTLACSPDGRTLASGDSSGTIQLFDFESLRPLYRINSDEYCIRNLSFSGDSHRLMDIRRSECRVWDPMVLVRQDSEEQNSNTISTSTGPQKTSLECAKEVTLVTSLACHGIGNVFFCGKSDGSVHLYETKTGRQNQKLFNHANGVSILSLFFDHESNTLISHDITSRIIVHRLAQQLHGWKVTEVLLDHHTGAAVQQVLTNPGSTRMLVCTPTTDTLWRISLDGNTVIANNSWDERGARKWGTHPSNHDHLMLIQDNIVHLYSWGTLERVTEPEGILLEGSILPELTIQYITTCFNSTVIATAFSESGRPHSRSKLILWNASDFTAESKVAAPIPKYRTLADQVRFLIGDEGKRLVFLHNNGWVSSAEDQAAKTDVYDRHFFIPADWLTTNNKLMTEVTRNGDIIFVKRDEVAVIKRGLDNVEQEVSNARQAQGKGLSLVRRKRSPLRKPFGTS